MYPTGHPISTSHKRAFVILHFILLHYSAVMIHGFEAHDILQTEFAVDMTCQSVSRPFHHDPTDE